MSSKGPQIPQEVKKMYKRYPRSSGFRFSTDPQNALNFLKRSSKPSMSTEVNKRYSRRPQIPQKVINVLKILWSSKVPQMVIKWSSQIPRKFLKTVRKKVHRNSWKGPEMFFNLLRSSGPQVFKKSSKGPQNPQKGKKMHKRYPRSSQPSGLNWSSKYPQKVKKCTKGPQRPQDSGPQMILKLLKSTSNSSNSSKVLKRYSNRLRSPQKFINVLKVLRR